MGKKERSTTKYISANELCDLLEFLPEHTAVRIQGQLLTSISVEIEWEDNDNDLCVHLHTEVL